MGGFKDELVRAESGLSSSSSLESNTLGRFEEGADAAVLGDLEACTTAVCAARAFTLDKMDCKSGAAVVDGLTEAAPACGEKLNLLLFQVLLSRQVALIAACHADNLAKWVLPNTLLTPRQPLVKHCASIHLKAAQQQQRPRCSATPA